MKKILILLFFIGLQLNGQELFHRTLDSDNGLPSNKVHYVFEDSKGYLWFGTENGVARWDSKNWVYYTIKDGLPNNEVLYIFEDSKRRIWFSTFSNELCYLKNDTIFNRKNDKRLEKINIIKGGKLTEYKDKIFYAPSEPTHQINYFNIYNFKDINYTNKAYNVYNCKINFINNQLFYFENPKEISKNLGCLVYKGNFYHSGYNQIEQLDDKSFKIIDYNTKYYYIIDSDSLDNFFNSYFIHKRYFNELIKDIKTPNYINKFLNTNPLDYLPINIFKTRCKILLAKTFNGNLKDFFIKKNDTLEVYNNFLKINNKYQFNFHNNLNYAKLLNDKLFNITSQNILFYNLSNVKCENITLKSINKNAIKHIFKIGNELYFTSENGFYSNINSNKTIPLYSNSKIYGLTSGDNSNNLVVFSDKIINITTKKPILNNEIFTNFKGISYSSKHKLYTINNGNQGLYIQYLNKKALKISNLFTYISYIDGRDRLWIGTINKLFITNTFLPKVMGEKVVKLNYKIDVFCSEIKEDNKGNIFFTTNDGVYIIDKQNRKYHLSDKYYLSSNELVTLKLDTQNQSFFVASRNGVNQIKYSEKKGKLQFEVVNKFFKNDGLSSNEIKDILIDGDSLWVATAKGLDLITNKRFRPDTLIIPLHINRVYINDSIWLLDSFYQLKHDQNNIKIDYSAIYYQRRDRLDIRYRLIEDGDMTTGTIENSLLHLFSLASGNYTLQLYAFDRDYPYIKSNFITLKFQIKPPYYKTWWFFSFVLLLASSIIMYILRIRYIRDKEKLEFKNTRLELEKNLSKFKLEALKAEMNPHFIFNCLNSIKDFILRAETEKSQYYLSQLSKLIRIALYNTKEEFISLRSEIEFIDLYIELEQLRFQEKFVFKKIIEDKNLLNAEVPTMVLQPFFENAIRHGKIGQLDNEGILLLEVRQENDFIVFNIKDNGIGLSKAAEIKSTTESGHKSMAMDIIQERIKIYNLSYNLDISLEVNEIKDSEFKTEVILKYILD